MIMPDDYASVESDGLIVSSNSESPEEMQEILGVTPEVESGTWDASTGTWKDVKVVAKPAEKPSEKPPVDAAGREHDEKGRFKAKPIPDKEDAKEKPQEAKGEETKPEEAPEKVEEKKKRPDARQRVEQATRAAAEHRRAREAVERENHALRQALGVRKEAGSVEKPKAQPRDGEAPPELAEGDDPIDFVRKTSEWSAKRAQRESDQKQHEQHRAARFQQEVARQEENYGKAWTEREKKEPGFQERIRPELLQLEPTFLMEPGQKATVWNALAAEITNSSVPIDLMIHLTEHEDELQRIATLGPRELTRTIAKLEAKLEAATAGTPAPAIPPYRPSAAEPVTPVTGAATTADGPPDVENSSFEEWYKHHNAEEKKRRRA